MHRSQSKRSNATNKIRLLQRKSVRYTKRTHILAVASADITKTISGGVSHETWATSA